MSVLNIIAVVVFLGFAMFSRWQSVTQQPTSESTNQPVVISDQDLYQPPSSAPTPPSPFLIPEDDINSQTDVQIDTNISGVYDSSEQIVYPGAQLIKSDKDKIIFQTNDSADTVYEWYKNELNSRGYHIGNDVKTRANDKFKAVLQATKEKAAIKVTIDQENDNASTFILLE